MIKRSMANCDRLKMKDVSMVQPFRFCVAAVFTAVLAAAPLAANAAPGPESPQAFLLRLYAPYVRGDHNVSPTGRRAPAIFDAHLTWLIRRDQRMAKGEVGALDGDPICDCQDFEPLKDLSITAQPAGPGRASAVVRFRNGGAAVTLTYTLVAHGLGWRVADIGSVETPSLTAYLEQAEKAR
jgi:hypothetical protein